LKRRIEPARSKNVWRRSANAQRSIALKLPTENGTISRGDLRIADGEDAMVLFNPTSPQTARLAYYNTSGGLKWEKDINLSEMGYDLSRALLVAKISSNGKRVAIYVTQDEEDELLGVYDEKGNLVSGRRASLGMAPDGKYFFDCEVIFDQNFSRVKLMPEMFDFQDTKGHYYEYNSRVYENSMLVTVIFEVEMGAANVRTVRRKTINKRVLCVYDLSKNQLIAKQDLMLQNGKSYDVSLDDGHADLKKNNFSYSCWDPQKNELILFIFDLRQKVIKKKSNVASDLLALSDDGSLMLLSSIERRNLAYSLLDLTRNENHLGSFPRNVTEIVEAFSFNQGALQVSSRANYGSHLSVYSKDRKLFQSLYGSFSLRRKIGLLPVPNARNSSTIDLVKVEFDQMEGVHK
jgi:hypothetical protein